jgi:hypothetical protein
MSIQLSSNPRKRWYRRLRFWVPLPLAGLIALAVFRTFTPIVCGPTVDGSVVWIGEVQRGDMRLGVRAPGARQHSPSRNELAAFLEFKNTQGKDVAIGQPAEVDTGTGVIRGVMARIGEHPPNSDVVVEISLVQPLAPALNPGSVVDGIITVGTLRDVLWINRPVHGEGNSESSLFKLIGDGSRAARGQVKYGTASVNMIQVLGGLKIGDRVILSDMSHFDAVDVTQIR